VQPNSISALAQAQIDKEAPISPIPNYLYLRLPASCKRAERKKLKKQKEENKKIKGNLIKCLYNFHLWDSLTIHVFAKIKAFPNFFSNYAPAP